MPVADIRSPATAIAEQVVKAKSTVRTLPLRKMRSATFIRFRLPVRQVAQKFGAPRLLQCNSDTTQPRADLVGKRRDAQICVHAGSIRSAGSAAGAAAPTSRTGFIARKLGPAKTLGDMEGLRRRADSLARPAGEILPDRLDHLAAATLQRLGHVVTELAFFVGEHESQSLVEPALQQRREWLLCCTRF